MDYAKTIDYLFSQLPVFQSQGAGAYKPGLDTARALARAFGNPEKGLKIVHVAGTNGKGSTSHALASVLMAQGYKVGLYTSPHLADFRERIRVNGKKISKRAVASFVSRYQAMGLELQPSFFELTTIMAFEYFAMQRVDWAVIEVGLGGRLDTTNIVDPSLCVITNISLDHTALLGSTAAQIAAEKAGIIKRRVPVVVGQADSEVRSVLSAAASAQEASIVYSEDTPIGFDGERYSLRQGLPCVAACDLQGDFQYANINTVMHALAFLPVRKAAVLKGLANVQARTGLMGRWMQLAELPLTICDTGHNPGAWQHLGPRLAQIAATRQARIVVGFAADKDVDSILGMMPPAARFYFVAADSPRSLPAAQLKEMAAKHGLHGEAYPSVAQGLAAARTDSVPADFIFIGGSNFVVAEIL